MLTERDLSIATRIEVLSRNLMYCKQDFRHENMENFMQLDAVMMANAINQSVRMISDRVAEWDGFKGVLIKTMETLNDIKIEIIKTREKELEQALKELRQSDLQELSKNGQLT